MPRSGAVALRGGRGRVGGAGLGLRGGGGGGVLGCWCIWLLVCAAAAGGAAAAGSSAAGSSSAPACRGLCGGVEDWWLLLKHPAGYEYSYVAASSGDGSWQHGHSLLEPANPLAATLEGAGLAAGGDGSAGFIYNDADPAGQEHWGAAHSKGVVAFRSSSNSTHDDAAGLWLVHSAPRFPGVPGLPGWAQLQHGQTVFGQHFVCVSLAGRASIAAVSRLLLASGPFIYHSRLPASLAAQFPGWAAARDGRGWDTRAHAIQRQLQTVAGQPLLAFAKTPSLPASLTDAVVGPGLGAAVMLWQTWRRSHDALPSACASAPAATTLLPSNRSSSSSSLNIDAVQFPAGSARGGAAAAGWSATRDHSKWGVSSAAASSRFACLGDHNRAAGQAHRGGSFVCLRHAGLWRALHGIVAAAEACAPAGWPPAS